jgi:hypothetical protein
MIPPHELRYATATKTSLPGGMVVWS